MSEYTDQLLTERRAHIARIAELEKALARATQMIEKIADDTQSIGHHAAAEKFRTLLKGTK